MFQYYWVFYFVGYVNGKCFAQKLWQCIYEQKLSEILKIEKGSVMLYSIAKIRVISMNRILMLGLWVLACVCTYADTEEYLKKIKDSFKLQVDMQPKEGAVFVLNVQTLNLDDDILFNESAFICNVEVIVSVSAIDKKQQEVVSVMACGTYMSCTEPSFPSRTINSKYLMDQPTKDFLRKLKEISCDPSFETIYKIEVTFSFFNLLKSDKIDLSKIVIHSEPIELEGEKLNMWLNFARSLSNKVLSPSY